MNLDIIKNPNSSFEEKEDAVARLDKLPRSSSPVRVRNRCFKTGRPRGVIRRFNLSRISFREMALRGEIPGVTNYDFLRLAYNEKQKAENLSELDPLEFMELTQTYLSKLKMRQEFLNRDLNQGFSGGEKKRNEILQMLLLEPKLVILDEIDSGVDVDAIKVICNNINENINNETSLIIITHYPRILQYLKPDFVHIMNDGKLIKTGGLELVEQLEEHGYEFFK